MGRALLQVRVRAAMKVTGNQNTEYSTLRAICTYHKIPIISPGLFCWAYFRRGLLLDGILHFKIGWA